MAIFEMTTRQPRKFTLAVLTNIPVMLAVDELSPQQIADELGTTKQSLYQTCSKHKVSLDPAEYARGWSMRLLLRLDTRKKVEEYAARLGVPPVRLVELLLTSIATDDMFAAVLDLKLNSGVDDVE